MDKLAHAGAPGYRAADVWERLQQIDMVEDSVAEAFSVRRKLAQEYSRMFSKSINAESEIRTWKST